MAQDNQHNLDLYITTDNINLLLLTMQRPSLIMGVLKLTKRKFQFEPVLKAVYL